MSMTVWRSDGLELGVKTFEFSVSFTGENTLPVFSPDLIQYWVIPKETESTLWEYELPDVIEDDVADTVVETVTLGEDIGDFMEYSALSRKLTIEDLSLDTIEVGSYEVNVVLDDGRSN
jgi:hypothetical protein